MSPTTSKSNLNGSHGQIMKSWIVRYPSGVTKRMTLSYGTLMRLRKLGLIYAVIEQRNSDEMILVLR